MLQTLSTCWELGLPEHAEWAVVVELDGSRAGFAAGAASLPRTGAERCAAASLLFAK